METMQTEETKDCCGNCSGHGDCKACKCPCHKSIPVMVALIGLVFLLKSAGVLTAGFVNTAWPVLLILIGLKKMFKCKCC